MPFKKITHGKNKGKYKSESGKIYTKKQVRAYYATNGFKNIRKGDKMARRRRKYTSRRKSHRKSRRKRRK